MKLIVLSLGAVAALAVAQANAQVLIADTDGNGAYSLQELRVAFPEMTEENFIAADTNANGEIDMEELAAAVETGKIQP